MWTCAKCGEQHEDQFETCWKCVGEEARLQRGTEDQSDAEVAFALYEDASRLEARREFPSALAKYQEIVSRFPHTEAGRDAAKSIESLRQRK